MERAYCFRRNSKPERKRMVERITIDSSVIVAALREKEAKHRECKRILEKVKKT